MNMGIGTDLHISTHRHATLGFQTIYRPRDMNIYVHRYEVLTEILYTIHTYGRERDGGKYAYVPRLLDESSPPPAVHMYTQIVVHRRSIKRFHSLQVCLMYSTSLI